jgi:hypothetical protein
MDMYIFYLKKIKYQCWYLTPCCGLEVQKPTQALQSEKYIKEGKVLARLGFQSKIFPGPFTD